MVDVIVTVEYDQGQRMDLSLPMDVPTGGLAGAVAQALGISNRDDLSFSVRTEQGLRPISPNASLGDMGILCGNILILERRETHKGLKGGAYLMPDRGDPIYLKQQKITIGRDADDHKNDINLGVFDSEKVTSRRHAQLIQRRDGWYLAEWESKNGTFLNGRQLSRGEELSLTDEDEIIFGRKGGVRMIFVNKTDTRRDKDITEG